MSLIKKETYIFGNLFYLANKFQAIMDKDFARHGLTTKQWFLMAVLGEFFDSPPTLKMLAKRMGSSHQNVKQIALKLESKGFIKLSKDSEDKRAVRVEMTEFCDAYWTNRAEGDLEFFKNLFETFEEAEVHQLFELLDKLTRAVDGLD